jgi:hypothetical protein
MQFFVCFGPKSCTAAFSCYFVCGWMAFHCYWFSGCFAVLGPSVVLLLASGSFVLGDRVLQAGSILEQGPEMTSAGRPGASRLWTG